MMETEDEMTIPPIKLPLQNVVRMTCELFPQVFMEQMPTFCEEMLNKVREKFKKSNSEPILETAPNQPTQIQPPKISDIDPAILNEARRFMHQNPMQFNISDRVRDDFYYKYKRVQSLSELYEECLAQTPK